MMEGEGFFRRWSRLKSRGDEPFRAPSEKEEHTGQAADSRAPGSAALKGSALDGSAPVPQTEHDSAEREGAQTGSSGKAGALPTLDDALRMTPDADFSAFMARGVDKSVRRAAMKKLFAAPHFNQPDGLDIYMGDYTCASPLPASMLTALRQAQGFLQEQDKPDENRATCDESQKQYADAEPTSVDAAPLASATDDTKTQTDGREAT